MKHTSTQAYRLSRFILAVLALLAMLWTAPVAHAQPAITISQLLTQGFTNGPAPYSVRVTGINGVGLIGARFDDIYLDGSGTVRAHSGFLSLYNLNYDMTLASVNTAGGGQLSLNGVMTLPGFLTKALAKRNVTVPQAQPALVVDSSGNVAFQGGTFALPTPPYTFPFGPLTIENLSLTIKPENATFGGGADVGYGGGPTVAFCVPQGSARIHGDFLLVNGDLDRLGVGASNLKKPLGTSGTYLDSLTATIGNLAANGGADWFIQGNASVIGLGCPAPPGSANWPWRMNAQLSVNSAGFLEVKGDALAFGIPTGQAYFRYNPPYTVALGGSVNFVTNTPLQGIFIAEMGVQCTAGPQISGYARGKLTVPRSVPVAGGWVFGLAEASFNNSGFRGSVTVNVSPEIHSVCTPQRCLPGGCVTYWCPKWNKPRRTCRRCWDGPCFPAFCTPRIPAVSATVGFRFENGGFTFGGAAARPADPMVEPWEECFQHTVAEPETGNSLTFMANWSRMDKCSTGPCGRPIAPAGFQAAGAPEPLLFDVPPGEESVMFRLTWENPENSLAFMSVRYSDELAVSVSSDEVFPEARFLRSLDGWPGAYLLLDGQRREAIIGIPNPPAGVFSVQIDHIEGLGNYAVELLRQNIPPVVTVESALPNPKNPGEYAVIYTSTFAATTNPLPPTRFILAQTAIDPNPRFGTTHLTKAGGIYVVETIPSVNGQNLHYLHVNTLDVPDGEYTLIVNIDDPASLEVEAFSKQRITVHNNAAPAPVPSFATRADLGGFTINWEPSPSSNIQSYIVSYTTSALPREYEFNQAVDGDARTATVTNLSNGQPYLVTVFAMGTNGLQSCPAEAQRVIPTEGYGLNRPLIVSAPRKVATVDYLYVYIPQVYDADDHLRPSAPLPEPEELPQFNEPQGRQWTLVTAPAGMTIDPIGAIMWTPTGAQAGDHQVTVRVTDLSSLPSEQDTNMLVNPRFGEQTYTITVVGPNNPPAFERNHYAFLTAPNDTAYAGEVYRYAPEVLFPTNLFTLTIDDGPPGLTVIQEGTGSDITNVVVWNVPSDAVGHRVVLRAVPDLGPDTTADDIVLQEFFLAVSAPHKHLPQPTVITLAEQRPEGFGLRWIGNASAYQVQRATDLPAGPTLNLDFGGALPAGTALHGSAYLDSVNGALELNPDLGSQLGSLVIDDFAASQPVLGFEASFRMKIIPTSNPPADGFSLNWATDLPDGTFPGGEEGAGSGLTVSFDIYDNAGGEAPAIDVKWNGLIVAHTVVPISLFVNSQEYADVQIRLHPDATIDVSYAGESIYTRAPVPGAVALTGARFGIAARTGGLKATHTLDDLSLQLLLTPSQAAWQSITAMQPGDAVNYHVDTNAPSARAFYRIFAIP